MGTGLGTRCADVEGPERCISQDAGHNVKALCERIGHTDVVVTAEIYTHKSTGTDRDMAQAMGS